MPEAKTIDADKAAQEQAGRTLASGDIPHIYFNEFQSFAGISDFASIVRINERPIAVLHTSASVAKSFALQLLALVNWYENKTQQAVLTLDEAKQRMDGPLKVIPPQ